MLNTELFKVKSALLLATTVFVPPPVANVVAVRLASKMNGNASGTIPEVIFNVSTTAHILGGCPMGK